MAVIRKQLVKLSSILVILALVASVFVGQSLANKNKGEDIILYNGNIVLRGGKGKGKGGNIVVANSPSSEMMPYFDPWGGFGRR